MTDAVTYTVESGIATVRLDRPEKYNAMTLPMWRAVTDAVGRAAADDARALVLTGAGDLFCAGDDIGALADIEDERDVRALVDTLSDCFEAIERSRVPVVGRANGSAYGGGFELLLAADVTVVPEGAAFALPETEIGAMPLYAAKRLTAAVGKQRAADLALTGREIDGATAADWGLFARAVPASDLDEAVAEVVSAFERASPAATATTKAWLNAGLGSPAERVGMRTGLGYLFAGPDAREGAEAFLEDRDPDYAE
ncbi:enoyl-CoA hydratase/isomerase family protein [Halorientalis marina]|jgi:enoyl-CoA hydratase/carnithine racemase|uniref:enoyl-CoA hydratase/isomerase family protein n=1 Tax=Halorientalis marina TaxID=2931976 RepID=UPI001FF69609|nr:enoyl-CoA hydratase/isomerase family protein [Halorientalis marina]